MKFFVLFFIVFFVTTNLSSRSLYETDFYEIDFISNNIENDKLNKIKEIKFKSILSIFKKILINHDYDNIKRNLNEDQINVFIKNLIIEEEKIINNRYKSFIKINYKKKKIIEYLRSNNLDFVEYLPKNLLTIIYENNDINQNLFTKNNTHYDYLLKNKSTHKFFRLPNLDLNDRYILNKSDIKNKNIEKFKKFSKKYNTDQSIIIISKVHKNKINYLIYLFINNKIIEINDFQLSSFDFSKLFLNLEDLILNEWKLENKIENNYLNTITCEVNYFNLFELKQIKINLNNISLIKNFDLKSISYKKNFYDINFYGKKEMLPKFLNLNKLEIIFSENICRINLK